MEPTPIHQPPELPSSNGDRQAEIFAEIRKARDSALLERFYDLELPGWGRLLGLRLGPLSGARLNELAERVTSSRSPDRSVNGNADILVNATRAILYRPSLTEPFEPLTIDDDPARLDEELARNLGIELDANSGKARQLMFGLWAEANAPDIAIGAAAGEYMDWARKASSEVEGELVGE